VGVTGRVYILPAETGVRTCCGGNGAGWNGRAYRPARLLLLRFRSSSSSLLLASLELRDAQSLWALNASPPRNRCTEVGVRSDWVPPTGWPCLDATYHTIYNRALYNPFQTLVVTAAHFCASGPGRGGGGERYVYREIVRKREKESERARKKRE